MSGTSIKTLYSLYGDNHLFSIASFTLIKSQTGQYIFNNSCLPSNQLNVADNPNTKLGFLCAKIS